MKSQLPKKAVWLFRLQGYWVFSSWLVLFSFVFLSFIIPIFIIGPDLEEDVFTTSIMPFMIKWFIGLLLIVLISSEIYSRMAYKRWFYEFTPNEFKFEKGIIWKRYSSIPYQRIQNVEIKRGILERMVGLSRIEMQTAGYSVSGIGRISEGYIPALSQEDAEKVQDWIVNHIKRSGK